MNKENMKTNYSQEELVKINVEDNKVNSDTPLIETSKIKSHDNNFITKEDFKNEMNLLQYKNELNNKSNNAQFDSYMNFMQIFGLILVTAVTIISGFNILNGQEVNSVILLRVVMVFTVPFVLYFSLFFIMRGLGIKKMHQNINVRLEKHMRESQIELDKRIKRIIKEKQNK